MKKNNQLGRSMVEMLGVLAIIGVLSVTAIAGYRYAMEKYAANTLINELNLFAQDAISGHVDTDFQFSIENQLKTASGWYGSLRGRVDIYDTWDCDGVQDEVDCSVWSMWSSYLDDGKGCVNAPIAIVHFSGVPNGIARHIIQEQMSNIPLKKASCLGENFRK